MCLNRKLVLIFAVALGTAAPIFGEAKKEHESTKKKVESTEELPATLWRNPGDIRTRNLYYGSGGEAHQPHGTFTFVKEDLDGTNPKFVVRDDSGMKWKVKLGEEAGPETAATRFVWAVGYYTNEDYFVKDLQPQQMPAHLHRGQNRVGSDAFVHDVRLKREPKGQEKMGIWRWRRDPFTSTRELNGLRVIMALINNWDLKDENNAIYEEASGRDSDRPELVYLVSDLGASFGTAGAALPHSRAKGNLESYIHSKFITKVTPEYVDFQTPTLPSFPYQFAFHEYFSRVGLRWIGRRIPRADARWIGQLLAELTPAQIRDAFRASGYAPEEVDGFSKVVEKRIAALNSL
jgi:hypothetical protein